MHATTVFAATCALVCCVATATAQSTGSVFGRVISANSGAPLPYAEIWLADGGTRAVADARGEFRMSGVRAGLHHLRVRLLGFRAFARELMIGAGEEVRVEISLQEAALPLDEIVVTASRRDQRLADVAVTTEVLRREDIERSGASDLSAVLTEHTGIDLQGGHPNGAGLMLQGIGSERLTASGHGESSPIGDNSSATGRQQNRRVEVIIENRLVSAR